MLTARDLNIDFSLPSSYEETLDNAIKRLVELSTDKETTENLLQIVYYTAELETVRSCR